MSTVMNKLNDFTYNCVIFNSVKLSLNTDSILHMNNTRASRVLFAADSTRRFK
jgi:hypothetical protein